MENEVNGEKIVSNSFFRLITASERQRVMTQEDNRK